jgi:hypothetical protein
VAITEFKKRKYSFLKEFTHPPREIDYILKTEPFGWEVKRNLNDLEILRKKLVLMHPGIIVPPIHERFN